MFRLTLHDNMGVELVEGDIVKVINRGHDNTIFFSEVRWIEKNGCKEGILVPFHTFSFHSFQKIEGGLEALLSIYKDRLIECIVEGVEYWYVSKLDSEKLNDDENEEDEDEVSKYLMDWRQCEYLISEGCYRITKE